MTHRVTMYVALVLGLFTFGCGGGRDEEPTTRATAGEEEPPEMEPAPVQPPPPAAAGISPVTEAEVEAFAQATIELIMLEEQGMARVEAGEPVEDVQADLQPRVSQVFQESQLTPDRYNEIADRAGEDAALRARIQRELRDRVAEVEEPA